MEHNRADAQPKLPPIEDTFGLGAVPVTDALRQRESQLAEVIAERDRLRSALIQAGRNAGAFLEDTVSTEFLMGVPEEVRLVSRDAQYLCNQTYDRAKRAENERDSLREQVGREDTLLQETLLILGVKGGDLVSLCAVAEELKAQLASLQSQETPELAYCRGWDDKLNSRRFAPTQPAEKES